MAAEEIVNRATQIRSIITDAIVNGELDETKTPEVLASIGRVLDGIGTNEEKKAVLLCEPSPYSINTNAIKYACAHFKFSDIDTYFLKTFAHPDKHYVLS